MTAADTSPTAPPFAVAGSFLEHLAAGEFDQLATTLEREAALSALLPSGFREWQGPEAICAAFIKWFGDADGYEVADAALGQVGSRLQLRWRLRVSGGRFGDAVYLVEQHVYADAGPTGRIQHMSLLCSGFCNEHADE